MPSHSHVDIMCWILPESELERLGWPQYGKRIRLEKPLILPLRPPLIKDREYWAVRLLQEAAGQQEGCLDF
jgi:hypothetical protein